MSLLLTLGGRKGVGGGICGSRFIISNSGVLITRLNYSITIVLRGGGEYCCAV